MKVFTHNKDLLDVTEADTIVLPVDGSAPGLEGNLARRFMRHVGVEKMHQLYAPPPYYPFDGEPLWSNIAGLFPTHFEWICCIDSLSHADGADHRANLRKTLRLMFDGMSCGGVGRSVACPILTGGKRIDPVDAIHIMLEETDRFTRPGLDLPNWQMHITEPDKQRFELLQSIVR